MKIERLISFALIALLVGVSQAQACPVCFQSGGEERWAFYATTAFLTVLPLSFVGGAVYGPAQALPQAVCRGDGVASGIKSGSRFPVAFGRKPEKPRAISELQ